MLHRRDLLLPFIVLLQNEHTTLAENGENLIIIFFIFIFFFLWYGIIILYPRDGYRLCGLIK